MKEFYLLFYYIYLFFLYLYTKSKPKTMNGVNDFGTFVVAAVSGEVVHGDKLGFL